ncbi:hypothetical protein PpBr36_06913 [Pyricularia pennisetigena]|uniref:hypothetical protein n=1 Tax=Pyricularia pennisetigena TaxID=1578925 RepID=UPI001153123B|nr:hypothetical protein PpBr36_06913 [Pyricularia pennisetigena]TLS25618.1 hypothetical protein PpBr36_06913 [Pyricularia pennisetigena]
MRLSTLLVPVASILSLACAQIGAIDTAIAHIRRDVEALKDAFNTGAAASITSSFTKLDDSISTATTVVHQSPDIGFLHAFKLASYIGSLYASIDQAFTVIKTKRSASDALGLTAAVRTSLVSQRSAVDTLGTEVVAKVPRIIHASAKSFMKQVDNSYASAITAYS